MPDESAESQITLLIEGARNGDSSAENELCEKVFHELYRIAKRVLPDGNGSIHPTMLVRELWVKLFTNSGLNKTENRRYFFTVAADQMRKIMIDHYRHRKTLAAGGDRKREPFEIVLDQAIGEFDSKNEFDFEALNNAIERLKSQDERLYQLVMHRYFSGQTIEQTAELMGISESSVQHLWRLARAKLYSQLKDSVDQ